MYQILFTDLDGTLLNTQSELSPGNIAAVAAAFDAGKQVVICSGRSPRALEAFERRLGLVAPGRYGLGFQGACAYETLSRKTLHRQTMEADVGLAAAEFLDGMGASVVLYAGDDAYAVRDTPGVQAYARLAGLPITQVARFRDAQGEAQKVLVKGAPEELARYRAACAPLFGAACSIFTSAFDLLELTHPQAHKGNGIAFLTSYLGIPIEETIAIGDEANDVEMLRAAGLGLSVANATDDAKAAADTVMKETNDEDAVARAIYTYLLP